ncbi:MAG: putative sugar nucleotidyl transferase [Candidatus Zixiibacteriota bacterium]
MKKSIVIFEDEKAVDFYPLTLIRPVYFLRPGIRSLYERFFDSFSGYSPNFFCRSEIADYTSEKTPISVNGFKDIDAEEIIFINGRLKYSLEFINALKEAGENVILTSREQIAAFKKVGKLKNGEIRALAEGDFSEFYNLFSGNAQKINLDLPFYNYLWDLVGDIEISIENDFKYFRDQDSATGFLGSPAKMRQSGREFPGVELISPENIYISRDAEIHPGVVIDASGGPVFIGNRVKIEPHTYLIGPDYIGKETFLVGGKITGCSIGSVCRIGGEVEESIIQGYTNKYHAGFLGHAYLGEWVNLGALTTNSDLKNNYSSVSVSIGGQMINTGQLKVGSFIGDFTKTAIGTMLNTGINIGISCNLVPGGLLIDKEIESFRWISPNKKMKYSFPKAFDTIERSMARRNIKASDALKVLFEIIAARY